MGEYRLRRLALPGHGDFSRAPSGARVVVMMRRALRAGAACALYTERWTR